MMSHDHSLPLPDPDVRDVERPLEAAPRDLPGGGFHAARERVVADFERRYLSWLLVQADGNVSRAARIAGVDRTTLYRLLGKHGMQQRRFSGRSPEANPGSPT